MNYCKFRLCVAMFMIINFLNHIYNLEHRHLVVNVWMHEFVKNKKQYFPITFWQQNITYWHLIFTDGIICVLFFILLVFELGFFDDIVKILFLKNDYR